MLHPSVILKKSKINGKGLFAKKFIPKGTIILIFEDEDTIKYTKKQYNKFKKRYKTILKKHCYADEKGNLFYIKGKTKYWNHGCEPNVAPSTINDNFDIVIRDIYPGDEITYDYAYLSPIWLKPEKCNCGSENCRKIIKREYPNSKIIKRLTLLTKKAEKNLYKVKQPLLNKR